MSDEPNTLRNLTEQDRALLATGENVVQQLIGRCRNGHTWFDTRTIRQLSFIVLNEREIAIYEIVRYPQRIQCPEATCGRWALSWDAAP